jgi:hypothetical protein
MNAALSAIAVPINNKEVYSNHRIVTADEVGELTN